MKREPAVLRELGEPAAPRETEAHMQQAGHPRGGKKSKTKKSKPEECPICMELTVGVETLPHGNAQGDVSSHRACETCQAAMLERNQKCPWCRDDVVWKQVSYNNCFRTRSVSKRRFHLRSTGLWVPRRPQEHDRYGTEA